MDECDEDSDGNIYEHDESDVMMVLIMMIIRLKRLCKMTLYFLLLSTRFYIVIK